MLRKGTLDQWGILKKFAVHTRNDPEFQISSYRFALRSHPNLMLRPVSEKVRAHYGLMLQGLAAAGYLLHNGIGDYRLNSQRLEEHLTEERRHRHMMLAIIIAALLSGIVAPFAR